MGEKNPWPTWADPGLVSSASSNDDVHLVLDGLGTFIGMVFPPLGAVFDLANAYLYYQEGRYGQATLSVLSAIPWAGDALGVAKYGNLKESVKGVAEIQSDAVRKKLFVLAADIAMSSGDVDESEDAMLEAFQRLLGIDDALATKIIEVLSLKYAV